MFPLLDHPFSAANKQKKYPPPNCHTSNNKILLVFYKIHNYTNVHTNTSQYYKLL